MELSEKRIDHPVVRKEGRLAQGKEFQTRKFFPRFLVANRNELNAAKLEIFSY